MIINQQREAMHRQRSATQQNTKKHKVPLVLQSPSAAPDGRCVKRNRTRIPKAQRNDKRTQAAKIGRHHNTRRGKAAKRRCQYVGGTFRQRGKHRCNFRNHRSTFWLAQQGTNHSERKGAAKIGLRKSRTPPARHTNQNPRCLPGRRIPDMFFTDFAIAK